MPWGYAAVHHSARGCVQLSFVGEWGLNKTFASRSPLTQEVTLIQTPTERSKQFYVSSSLVTQHNFVLRWSLKLTDSVVCGQVRMMFSQTIIQAEDLKLTGVQFLLNRNQSTTKPTFIVWVHSKKTNAINIEWRNFQNIYFKEIFFTPWRIQTFRTSIDLLIFNETGKSGFCISKIIEILWLSASLLY